MQWFNFHHHHLSVSEGIYNIGLAEEVPDIRFSTAIHPYDIGENWEIDFQKVKERSILPNCLAIGECGLDALINTPESLQETIFRLHIHWANTINKPLIIHCVRRFQEIITLCKKVEVPKIIHGFSKNQQLAESLLSHGFYLSFGKNLLHNVSLQDSLRKTPLDRLFLETDDKDFPISELYQKVAELKEIEQEHLHSIITDNFKRIFE